MSMDFEERLLAGCLQDEQILKRARRAKIRPKHLNDHPLRYLYKQMIEVSKVDTVTPETLKAQIHLDKKKDKSDKEAMADLINSLVREPIEGSGLSLKFMSDKRRRQDMIEMLTEGTDQLVQGTPLDELIDVVGSQMNNIRSSEEKYELFNYNEGWDQRQAERIHLTEDAEGTMKMGLNLSPFKKYFTRGFQTEEVIAIGGPTYAGKSILLTNFIRLAAHPKNGMNVLYVFAENRYVQAASRLDSIILNENYQVLYENALENRTGGKFFRKAKEKGWGQIIMAKVQPKKFTADTIDSMIEEIEMDLGIKIHVLAIDSPDHQEARDRQDAWHQGKGQVYYENKQLTMERGLINISTLPMKASSVKKESVQNEDAAGSYDISRVCDDMIMFNKSDTDQMLNRATIQVTKNRDGVTDSKKNYFHFDPSLRLIPWDEAFDSKISPEEDPDQIVYKIKKFKEGYTEQDGFNVKRANKKDEVQS